MKPNSLLSIKCRIWAISVNIICSKEYAACNSDLKWIEFIRIFNIIEDQPYSKILEENGDWI